MENASTLPTDVPRIYPAWPQNAHGRAFATIGRDDMHDEKAADVATMRAVAYIRVNEHAFNDTEAVVRRIERQRVRCGNVAEQHGLTIAREYVDMTSAVRLSRRPELVRLLAELPTLRVQCVVVADFARLSREAREIITIEQRLIEVGARLLVWGESEIHAHLRRRMTTLVIEHGVGRGFESLEDDQE